ncbi:MAG: hypothetical protein MI924_24135 [Chloroflexales bacterium]|nr:hypothetical protein [Chloroflexales bacterium]
MNDNYQASTNLHSLMAKQAPRRTALIVRHSPFIALLGLLSAAMLLSVLPVASGQASADDQPVVVRISNISPADAQRLIKQGVDLLEARDGPDLFALATSDQQTALREAGWDIHIEAHQTMLLQNSQPFTVSGGYRSVEETEQFLRDRAARYPHVAMLADFGDSWQRQQSNGAAGYDLLALRLTNRDIAGPKPVFFLMAAIHAREWTTAEIATRFIDHLLINYNIDPDVTWLLNEHEIVVAPMLNPDGRKIAEQGYLQRKNVNPGSGDACKFPPSASNQYGVDLNRNSSFFWNSAGTSQDPCSQVFPGSGPASEPETQALQAFITALYPARPRPANGAPAPDDTSGVLISLHSYSNLILWPWGYTSSPAPNAVALERLGRRFARYNDYTAHQSKDLYLTSGTTDEWAYAELGIAAYTFEIGPMEGPCAGFTPPYSCLDGGVGGSFWPRNLPALLYAARVAHAPYTLPAGPDVSNIAVINDTKTLTVTATFDGRDQIVSAAELSFSRSGEAGSEVFALQALDGAFDSYQEQAQLILPMSALLKANTPRVSIALLRGRNVAGAWGPMSATWLKEPYRVWAPLVEQSAQRNNP